MRVHFTPRERKVIELYNEGKSTHDIAKEIRMSLRDINTILKKHGVNHGIVTVEKDNKSSNNNEKATQAYKLFSEGRKPVQVAIELNLDELYEIYPQIEYCLPSFLKIHKALKKRGLNPQNTESFVDIIELGVVKLPELQDQYQKLQDKVQGLRYNLQDMQYRKQGLERYLQATQKRINELTDAQNTLQQTFDLGAEKVSNLYKEKYWLEQSIASHKNSNKE